MLIKMLRSILKKLRIHLTFLDLAIILILITTVTFSLFKFSRTSGNIYIDLTYEGQDWTEKILPPSYFKTDTIIGGDKMYDSAGNIQAEVVDVKKIYWNSNRQTIKLTLNLHNILTNKASETFSFNGQSLFIGQPLLVQLGKTSFTGLITDIYSQFPNPKKATKNALVTVKYRNLESWHAAAIKDFSLKDASGVVIASVNSIDISPAEMLVPTSGGELRKTFNPIGKDVIVTFYLKDVRCTSTICYFNDIEPLTIGSPFSISSEAVSINPENQFEQTNYDSYLPSKNSIMKVVILGTQQETAQ